MKTRIIFTLLMVLNSLLHAQNWSVGTPGNIYYDQGNVGIGTNNPLDKLHVNGNISINPDGATTPSYINFKRTTDGWNAARIGQAYSQVGYGGHLVFETNGNTGATTLIERMRITYNGNVGIGTTNPTHKLQINDGTLHIVNPSPLSYQLIFRDDESTNSSYFYHRKTANYQILGSNKNGTGTLRKLGFAIGGGDNEVDVKMTLDQNGNVGIGTLTPVDKLHVYGNISLAPDEVGSTPTYINFKRTSDGWNAARIGQRYAQAGYGSHLVFETNADGSATNLVERMRITYTGNVLIAKTSQVNSANKLDVNGSIRSNEVVVNTTGADFVFDTQYKLPKLSEVEQYILEHKHLPEIQSAGEMQNVLAP